MMEQQEVRGDSSTPKSEHQDRKGRRDGRGGEEMMEEEEEEEKDRWRRL